MLATLKPDDQFIYKQLHEFRLEYNEHVSIRYGVFSTNFIEMCQKEGSSVSSTLLNQGHNLAFLDKDETTNYKQ